MKRLWKKVTPIPPEMNGHGYLWDCTKCGYCLTSTAEYPKCKCPKCGASEVDVFDVTEAAFPYERYCRYCGAKMKGVDDDRI